MCDRNKKVDTLADQMLELNGGYTLNDGLRDHISFINKYALLIVLKC